MKKVGLYARVSTDRQALVQVGSLDTQLSMLEKYVEIKDMSEEDTWKIIRRFREEAKSGKDTNRPEFQHMLEDIQKGKINVLLCTKIDRVSRSLLDFYNLCETLTAHDVTFISLNEQFDTSTPMGRFALKIILAGAELEREQTAERTREKMQWRAEQGLANGGQILGYDIDPDHPGIPKVNEEEKQLVRLIFETYAKEKSYHRVARYINGKGYRTKCYTSRRGRVQGGKKFIDTTIAWILHNEFYIGKIVHKGEEYEGKHEAIIPIKLWTKVQAVSMTNRTGKSKNRVKNLHAFPLQGMVRCGWCGSYMTPYYGYAKGKPYYYYDCTKRRHTDKRECKMISVPATALENLVAERLKHLSRNQTLTVSLVEKATHASAVLLEDLNRARNNLVKMRQEIGRKIDALVDGIATNKVEIKSISQKILALEEQKDQLDQEILSVELQIEEAKKKVANASTMQETLTTFAELYSAATSEEKKQIMQMHICEVVWTPSEVDLAVYEIPTEMPVVNRSAQSFSESYSLAPRIPDSLKPLYIWDKFQVYQWHTAHTPVISVGCRPENPPSEPPKTYPNPLKEARRYRQLLDEGQARTQADLARTLGVSKARITQMLNLLKLDAEIQEFMLGLEDTDERLRILTERRLRPLVRMGKEAQKKRFWEMVGSHFSLPISNTDL